jgi:acyl carrier protein
VSEGLLNKDEFLAAVAEILNQDPKSLTMEQALDGTEGYDSLAKISIIALVDEHFNVVLTPAKLRALKTVGDIYALKG